MAWGGQGVQGPRTQLAPLDLGGCSCKGAESAGERHAACERGLPALQQRLALKTFTIPELVTQRQWLLSPFAFLVGQEDLSASGADL